MNILNIKVDTAMPKGDLSGILLRDVRWSVTTAGPSPDNNKRTELFLLGCKKAINGNPCKGCFNSSTWNNSKAIISHNPIKMAEHINNNAPNKYITIGGGEPTDQIDNLITLCKELKEKYNFHIMVYTWRDLKKALINDYENVEINSSKYEKLSDAINELIKYIDVIVDGQYIEEERMWDGEKKDGFLSSIGSGNQRIWATNSMIGVRMEEIKSLKLREDNLLEVTYRY